ncbi:Ammonium transporter NrgA [Allorhodopirellula heiligendammensis]|uniref:Ammonium transporter n=2 Tax=Allorhodopirellula heiligendammensis TaxID=2714739 RepID=A0A5C6BXL6_9BACT|nr:Ammonium transporter NrgA [Allorhodopirellula heiligendammensis]
MLRSLRCPIGQTPGFRWTHFRSSWLMMVLLLGMTGIGTSLASVVSAQDEVATVTEVAEVSDAGGDADLGVGYALDNAVLFLCAVLVLFMQAGFAMVEVGMNSAKNTVNILSKNVMDLSVGALLFFAVGFGLMYPTSYMSEADAEGVSKVFAFGGTGIYTTDDAARTFSPQTDWFFQAVFAATAATIVSGAVAGRMKFTSYLVYSAILTGLVYPISGYWKWGGGWINEMGFQDFAGSAVVHAVGGFAGLAGALFLGPRLGRYTPDGRSVPLPGHNVAFSALGVFILWVGWYGFNPGSQLAFQGTGDIDAVALIAVNTTLAAAAGAFIATFVGWGLFGKPDLTMSLNGALGGLVGITACCDAFTNSMSIVVGGIAGVLVVLAIVALDRLKIDDPVGAFPVHGVCGVWGCMAMGIFPNTHFEGMFEGFVTQSIGTLAICGWSFVTMSVVFGVLKAIGMLRVTPAEEHAGLDISEHGMHAYPSDAIHSGSAA